MTCVVGCVSDDGTIYIGADSASTNESWHISTTADEKVFINNGVIIAFVGSFRVGQLLRYSLQPPEQLPSKEDMEYLINDFADAIRNLFKDKGILTIIDGVESFDGQFLIGYNSKLYSVQSDMHIERVVDNYVCIGCGGPFAAGSMFETQGYNITIEERITRALNAAQHHSAGVKSPFHVLKLEIEE